MFVWSKVYTLQYPALNTLRMKIALLEDDTAYHEVIIDMLNELGHTNIRCFTSIKEMEESNKISEIDVLVADYFLGQGSTVSDLFKSNLIPKRTKVLVLTNYFEDAVYDELSRLRKVFFLKKSLDRLEFKNALETTINSNFHIDPVASFESRFYVKVGSALKPIDIDDIVYLEVDGKYVNVHLFDKKSYPIRSTLTDLNDKLSSKFIRVHSGFIVNLDFIESVALNDRFIMINDREIPFSRTYKDKLFSSIAIA